jgi:hypothetical protein
MLVNIERLTFELCVAVTEEDALIVETREQGLRCARALLNVLPPTVASAGRKKPDASLAGAANDFGALERLRRRAFAETVPAPKIPEQIPLALPDAAEDNEEV